MPATMQEVNHWHLAACAKAFWAQHELPCYQELLADTIAWTDPQPGHHWLDLGCGSGRVTRALWQRSQGKLGAIVGLDCAEINAKAYAQLEETLEPRPAEGTIRFVAASFLEGMIGWTDATFDGVVSGLAIQYAESFCESEGRWTCEAYDNVLAEVGRLLRPGGVFVFSVNVPEPSWGRVALNSLWGVWRQRTPIHYLRKSLRMYRYGGWLKRESRRGRFHYLPLAEIVGKLQAAGFVDIEHRLSYARQAFLVRCRKRAEV